MASLGLFGSNGPSLTKFLGTQLVDISNFLAALGVLKLFRYDYFEYVKILYHMFFR